MHDWMRAAVPIALAAMACQQLPPQPVFAPSTEPSPVAHAEMPTKSTRLIPISERWQRFESHLSTKLMSSLARVETVMATLCSPRCGQVTLLADPNLEAIATCKVDQPGVSSLISYKYDADEWAWLQFDSTSLFYVLAHEYGHHLDVVVDGRTWRDPWVREIRADVLAGCALQLDGADITKALTLKQDPDDGSDGSDLLYPPTRSLREAVAQGAAACRGTTKPTLTALVIVAQRVADPALEFRATRSQSK